MTVKYVINQVYHIITFAVQ